MTRDSFSERLRPRAIELVEQGLPRRQIAALLGVPRHFIRGLVRNHSTDRSGDKRAPKC